MLWLLSPKLGVVLVGLAVALLLVVRYGHGLPLLFGSLIVPPAVGLSLGAAYLLQTLLGLTLFQTFGLIGGALLGVTGGYLLVPLAGRVVVTAARGALVGGDLLAAVVAPWRVARWVRTHLPGR